MYFLSAFLWVVKLTLNIIYFVVKNKKGLKELSCAGPSKEWLGNIIIFEILKDETLKGKRKIEFVDMEILLLRKNSGSIKI